MTRACGTFVMEPKWTVLQRHTQYVKANQLVLDLCGTVDGGVVATRES